MNKFLWWFLILLCVAFILSAVWLAYANTPGTHTVTLTWTPGACGGVSCTTNLYRGISAGVCKVGATPYVTGIIGATYTDTTPPNGAVFYNVTNVDPSKGGESTCNGEVQVAVPSVTSNPHTGLQGTIN